MTKVSLYLSKIQTRFRRFTRAISLASWKHPSPSIPHPYATLFPSRSLSVRLRFSPAAAFVSRSVSFRSSPLVAPHLVFKCTNEATDQRNRRQCVHSRESKGRTRKREGPGNRQRLLLSLCPHPSTPLIVVAVPSQQHPV